MRRAAWRLNWICVRVAGVTGKPSKSDVQEEQRSSFRHSLLSPYYSLLTLTFLYLLYLVSGLFFFSIPKHFCLLFVSFFLISPIRFFSVLFFKSSFFFELRYFERKKKHVLLSVLRRLHSHFHTGSSLGRLCYISLPVCVLDLVLFMIWSVYKAQFARGHDDRLTEKKISEYWPPMQNDVGLDIIGYI